MRVGIPNRNGRVSPVFDVAGSLLVFDIEGRRVLQREKNSLTGSLPFYRAQEVAKFGTDVLICGAISWPLEEALTSAGIQVIPHICGNVDEVLGAYLSRSLGNEAFLMPGCGGGRYGWRRGRCRWRRLGSRGSVP